MKRSEALAKLKHFMSYENPYDDRDREDQILDYVERVLGMLPPERTYLTMRDEGHTMKVTDRTWEPEDEA